MRSASSSRPFEHSQRGDSGTNQMRKTWMTEGSAWMAEGIRHAQLEGTWNVPNVYRTGNSDNDVHEERV